MAKRYNHQTEARRYGWPWHAVRRSLTWQTVLTRESQT